MYVPMPSLKVLISTQITGKSKTVWGPTDNVVCATNIGAERRKIIKTAIIDENFHENIMVNVNGMESLLNKRAMMPQNRA